MKTNIMVDLETFGQVPGSVIVSIGACLFNRSSVGARFYRRIDIESCLRLGLKMDASTILWWLRQSNDARAELQQPAEQISSVLFELSEWITATNHADPSVGPAIWGNGASFDLALLTCAYNSAEIQKPWSHLDERCYRTLKKLYPDAAMNSKGIRHNALDDAISQAEHTIAIADKYNLDLWSQPKKN